jgi:hypothetical protein
MKIRIKQVPGSSQWWYVQTRPWWFPIWENYDDLKYSEEAAIKVAAALRNPTIINF